jgi:hypothetical protein
MIHMLEMAVVAVVLVEITDRVPILETQYRVCLELDIMVVQVGQPPPDPVVVVVELVLLVLMVLVVQLEMVVLELLLLLGRRKQTRPLFYGPHKPERILQMQPLLV